MFCATASKPNVQYSLTLLQAAVVMFLQLKYRIPPINFGILLDSVKVKWSRLYFYHSQTLHSKIYISKYALKRLYIVIHKGFIKLHT